MPSPHLCLTMRRVSRRFQWPPSTLIQGHGSGAVRNRTVFRSALHSTSDLRATSAIRYNLAVTTRELRQSLCGDAGRFTLPLRLVKDRLGDPLDIRILSKWCKVTGRDVVLMTFPTDEGNVEVFCPIGFLNEEETVLDGWIGAITGASVREHKPTPNEAVRGIDHLRGLFDDGHRDSTTVQPGNSSTPVWRKAKQRSFGESSDE